MVQCGWLSVMCALFDQGQVILSAIHREPYSHLNASHHSPKSSLLWSVQLRYCPTTALLALSSAPGGVIHHWTCHGCPCGACCRSCSWHTDWKPRRPGSWHWTTTLDRCALMHYTWAGVGPRIVHAATCQQQDCMACAANSRPSAELPSVCGCADL